MAMQLFNGCAQEPERSTDVTFTIDEHRLEPGHCLAGLEPDRLECHLLRVTVRNGDLRNGTRVAAFAWTLVDAQGREWGKAIVHDDAGLAANATRSIHVGVTTDAGTDVRRLVWDDYYEGRAEAAIEPPGGAGAA